MRECRSYNDPKPWQTRQTVVLPYPFGEERTTVCLDACLEGAMLALWAAGIETFGSCCRHGDGDPEVIIGQNATAGQVAAARRAISTVDGRPWTIMTWTLVRHEAES